jgi:hypothetical protein
MDSFVWENDYECWIGMWNGAVMSEYMLQWTEENYDKTIRIAGLAKGTGTQALRVQCQSASEVYCTATWNY